MRKKSELFETRVQQYLSKHSRCIMNWKYKRLFMIHSIFPSWYIWNALRKIKYVLVSLSLGPFVALYQTTSLNVGFPCRWKGSCMWWEAKSCAVNWGAGYNFSPGADQRELSKGVGTTDDLFKPKLTEIHQYSLRVVCLLSILQSWLQESSPEKGATAFPPVLPLCW